MVAHFVLEELGADYQLMLVDRKTNGQKSEGYLALNPTGRIPTLVDGDLVLFESAAICIHLVEKNLSSKLVPEINSPERPLFFQWLMYLTSTVQSELMVYFYPDKHTDGLMGASDIASAQEKRITDMLAILDKELTNKQFLVGGDLTICDLYIMMLSIWASGFTSPPLSFPHLGKYLRSLALVPSIKEVCRKENRSLEAYQ